jgi:diguanylate cyclase (GGDEF)-like protein/PAS domain S-box-containing protein
MRGINNDYKDGCMLAMCQIAIKNMFKESTKTTGDETFNRLVLDTIGVLIAVLDREGRIISFNHICEEVTGYTFEEVQGHLVWDFLIPPEQIDAVREVFLQLQAGDFPSKYENHWMTKEGGRRWVAWSNDCLLDKAGQVEFVIATGVDVTERKQAEEALKESETQTRLFLDSTAEGIYGVDTRGICTFINSAGLKMLGYQNEEDLVGKGLHDIIHHTYPDGRHYPREECNVRLSTIQAQTVHEDNEMHWRADGSSFPVEYWSRPMFKNGELVGAVVTFVDITERRKVEEQMLKLSSAIEQTADAVMITDVDGVIEYVNPAYECMSGYQASQLIGSKPSILKSGKLGKDFYHRLWETLKSDQAFSEVFINKKSDGSLYFEEKTITPIRESRSNIKHYVSTSRDITDRIETEKKLQYLAHHDALTDLPNRSLFLDRLKQALASARWHDRNVAVLFMDVDRFKNINDTLGHESGDQLLREMSERLIGSLRERDTIARFGGDEFVIMLDDVARISDVDKLVKKIHQSLERPFKIKDSDLHVTASIGISLFPNDGQDSSTLLRNADLAMYRAKDDGRNSYEFYSADMTTRAFERLTLENSLRQALDKQEFQIFYQPQVDIHSGKIIGLEALLRWQHPELGLVAPDHFIPLLEDTGLIIPVGEWVLQTACEQLAKWHQQGFDSLRMAVNLSSRQFVSTDLIDRVKDIIECCGVSADLLDLEITESLLMSQSGMEQQILEALAGLGIRLSIDDFGTGYSSLSYLRRLSIDALKIDRSFVIDIPGDPDDAAITEAIVKLGQTLRLDLVAEGVESKEQLDFLESIGCSLVQGFLFSKPLPSLEVTELLKQQPLKPSVP